MSTLNDLSQRLKAAVGMAGAAHAVFEMGNDETSDAGRWTLEEAVKNLRDIDIGLELAARRCHCESRQMMASREATSTDAAEEQSDAEDGTNAEDDAVQSTMDIFHRNVEAILDARADSMSPEEIARIRALLKGEDAARAASSQDEAAKAKPDADTIQAMEMEASLVLAKLSCAAQVLWNNEAVDGDDDAGRATAVVMECVKDLERLAGQAEMKS